MKTLYLLYFTLVSFCVFAQKKEAYAIRIHLEDAETGKNISDAKVTLEGFEIPALTAKYDKQQKVYYFTEIPNGYNTIMAYHKKYNEKGFQNIEGLPKELKLRLYTPYRIRIPNDSVNFYKEDNFKTLAVFNNPISDKTKCETYRKSENYCFVKSYFEKHFKHLILVNELDFINESYGNSPFYLVKKNGKPFKRFNDPLIKKLMDDKNILILYGMLLITKDKEREYFTKEGKPNYGLKFIKYINYDTITEKLVMNRNRRQLIQTNSSSILKKKNSSDINLSYTEKIKKGLLINDLYTLNNKEIDSIRTLDKKYKKEDLYDFILEDTKTYNLFHLPSPTMGRFDPIPYIAVSNILDFSNYYMPSSDRVEFEYIIHYDERQVYYYKKNKNLIESRQKIGSTIYQIKNNLASPFGTTDLIEYYNLPNEKINQDVKEWIQYYEN